MKGKKEWYIIDGYRPSPKPDPEADYKGHECILVLNTNEHDAHLKISIYFEDRDPVEGISFTVPAKRIRTFYTDDDSVLGIANLKINQQYSMAIESDIGVMVQYGRLDVQQENMAYMALMAHAE
ncbi:MAG: hypothetical protein IKU65_03940 [Oscillospiraceae bacterium]|nr:hypothetical protein [Oscillospiraceae bacterium]